MKSVLSILVSLLMCFSPVAFTSCSSTPTPATVRNVGAASNLAAYAWLRSQKDPQAAAVHITAAADILETAAQGKTAEAVQALVASVLPDQPDAIALAGILSSYYADSINLGNTDSIAAMAAGLRAGAAPFLTLAAK